LRKDEGREQIDPGAFNPIHGVYERDMVRRITGHIVSLLHDMLGIKIIPVGYQHLLTLEDKVKEINNILSQDPDVEFAIEIHLNAATYEGIKGAETLYQRENNKSKELAVIFQENILKFLDTRNRGVKPRDDLYLLNNSPIPTVITEADFISNNKVAKGLKEGFLVQTIAFAHAKAIWQIQEEGGEN